MLDIDYSNPRKFLISFGLTLIFASVIIIWTEVIFFVDRAENVLSMSSSNNYVADEYVAIIGPIIKTIPIILNTAEIVLFLGVGLFLAGIIWWVWPVVGPVIFRICKDLRYLLGKVFQKHGRHAGLR